MEVGNIDRKKQALATREKLYTVGIKLLRAKGFDNVHIEQIAKDAGVSIGTFYHHFNSKLDLFMELYRRTDKYFEEDVPKKLENKTAMEKILIFFSEYASIPLQDGLFLIQKIYTPENKMFLTQPRGMHELLLSIINSCQDNKEIRNDISAQEISDSLFLIARGVIFDWALRDGSYDPHLRMETMISQHLFTYIL